MPKRTRTHQLEDISIQYFEQILPDEWVCRRKSKDYGVDLEVEVFDTNGNSTGLTFNVQLKATENKKKERSVSIAVDRLEYLASFDVPAMIVRYCNASRTVHWIWITNIFGNNKRPSTKSLTIKFGRSDVWNLDTPSRIRRTLEVYRTILLSSRRTPIGLGIRTFESNRGVNFELTHAVAEIQDSTQMVISSSEASNCLPVEVWLDGDMLNAAIDVIASIGVRLERAHRDEIIAQLTYVLAFMAGRYEFTEQAKDLVRFICVRNFLCHSRELACALACQVMDDLVLCSDLASLNGFHNHQDLEYTSYISNLLSFQSSSLNKIYAIKRFYSEAIISHKYKSLDTQSSLHYSFGNQLYNIGDYKSAIQQYNLARKKNGEYLARDYFLSELAATLYFSKRYRMAASLYASSFRLTESHKTAICAGDASLFSADFDTAASFYETAKRSENEFETAEAALKAWMAPWCAEICVQLDINQVRLLSRVDFWKSAMNKFVADEEYDNALGSCLMSCFLIEDDYNWWLQALLISFKANSPQLLFNTFACAVFRCGYNAYSPFRDTLSENGVDEAGLKEFDNVVSHLYSLRSSDHGLTVRGTD